MFTSKEILRGIAVFSAVALVLSAGSVFLPVHGEEKIYDEVLRLHVIANSDSMADQNLKLEVRNAVIAAVEELTAGAADNDKACEEISRNIPALESAARAVIAAGGFAYPVSVCLTGERYPTRSYDEITLPAGIYKSSLQVKIGAAAGRNWWCILFPPLCLNASQAESEMKAGGFTKEQIELVTKTKKPRYAIRFKLLELFNQQ